MMVNLVLNFADTDYNVSEIARQTSIIPPKSEKMSLNQTFFFISYG